MNFVLWSVQIMLAVVFALHGWIYATWPSFAEAWHEKQHPGQPLGLPSGFRTFIGISELLAAGGLVLPTLTGILPWLTPLAAAGLIVVMIGSTVYHMARHEYSNVIISLVLIALCVVVVYGRFQVQMLPAFMIL